MHVFQSRFLRQGEVWFDQEPDQTPVDWIRYRQRPNPVPGAKWKYFHTLVVDLESSAEALLDACNKSTKYRIRRARDGDKFVCESARPITWEALGSFAQMYEPFASHKGLPSLDRPALERLASDGCLDLSLVKDAKGTVLVEHVYYRAANRSRLLYSVSLHFAMADSSARSAAGRANCLLTWSDMLRHKQEGLKHFDFGGWYAGNEDQARLDINRFKAGFGGKLIREYDCQQILTLKGRVILMMARLIGRAKLSNVKPRLRSPAFPITPTLLIEQPISNTDAT